MAKAGTPGTMVQDDSSCPFFRGFSDDAACTLMLTVLVCDPKIARVRTDTGIPFGFKIVHEANCCPNRALLSCDVSVVLSPGNADGAFDHFFVPASLIGRFPAQLRDPEEEQGLRVCVPGAGLPTVAELLAHAQRIKRPVCRFKGWLLRGCRKQQI